MTVSDLLRIVAEGADRTDARMGHHALILSDRAEVDAKRRIIAEDWPGDPCSRYILCLLALPYADHPDYDEAWRP